MSGVETVRALFDDFNRADFESAMTRLADDVDWGPPPDMPEGGAAYRGHDGVVKEFTRFMGAWESFHVGLVDATEAGDRVIAATHWRGVSRAGVEVDQHVFQVYEFAGGKVARVRQFRERGDALAAAGLT